MTKLVKILIWSYALLIIVEGALRKWVLPSLSDPLLVIRDPILLAIYGIAFIQGRFPQNGFVITAGVLGLLSIGASLIVGQTNLVVLAYGLRINYLHLPLIWVIADYFDADDTRKLGNTLLLLAIPITLLMVEQFNSHPLAWVNKGIGSDEGGQIFGAEGRIRPPGPFAFITGPQCFFPLCAAFLLGQLQETKRMKLPLLLACGAAVLVALPISISRTVMMATLIVGGTYVFCLLRTSGNIGRFLKPLAIAAIMGVLTLQIPIFKEGFRVFTVRWEQAAVADEGDGWQNILDRTLQTFTNPLHYAQEAPTFGHGIGTGSNVGARMIAGRLGFLLAEEEVGKIYLELGFLLGTAFIGFRFAIGVHTFKKAWQSLSQQKNALPLLILSASLNLILFGQWAPPTLLGFTVLGAGLVLATAKTQDQQPEDVSPRETEPLPVAPRKDSRRLPAIPKPTKRQV